MSLGLCKLRTKGKIYSDKTEVIKTMHYILYFSLVWDLGFVWFFLSLSMLSLYIFVAVTQHVYDVALSLCFYAVPALFFCVLL